MYLVSDSRLQHGSHRRALSEVEQDRLEVEELKLKKNKKRENTVNSSSAFRSQDVMEIFQ